MIHQSGFSWLADFPPADTPGCILRCLMYNA